MSCKVQNLSEKSVVVNADLNDGLGDIIVSSNQNVPAGETLTLTYTTTPVYGAYCKFTFTGSPEEIRGFIHLEDLGGSNTRLILPVPEPGRALLLGSALLALAALVRWRRQQHENAER